MEYKIGKTLIPEDKIKERVKELGEKISRDYAGKELVCVCVLKGAVIFLADLIGKHLQIVILAHLSETNNTPLLARMAAQASVQQWGDTHLFVAAQDRALPPMEITENRI